MRAVSFASSGSQSTSGQTARKHDNGGWRRRHLSRLTPCSLAALSFLNRCPDARLMPTTSDAECSEHSCHHLSPVRNTTPEKSWSFFASSQKTFLLLRKGNDKLHGPRLFPPRPPPISCQPTHANLRAATVTAGMSRIHLFPPRPPATSCQPALTLTFASLL